MSFWRRLFSSAPVSIVDTRPAEAAALCVLHAASFRRGWSEDEMEALLRSPQVLAHSVTRGRKTLGFVLSRCAADEAEILSIAVAASERGRGLARDLLQWHMQRLAGRGTRALFLEVEEGNTAARRLYDRAGFAQVGRRPSYYGAGAEPAAALVLRRDLT